MKSGSLESITMDNQTLRALILDLSLNNHTFSSSLTVGINKLEHLYPRERGLLEDDSNYSCVNIVRKSISKLILL